MKAISPMAHNPCMAMDSELVANFCSITDCTPSTAEYYLNAANEDLDMAIGLFYEGGGREAGDKDRDMQSAPTTVSRGISASGSANDITRVSVSTTANLAITVPTALPTNTLPNTLLATANNANIFNPRQMTMAAPVVHVIDDSSESDSVIEESFVPAPAASTRTRAQRLADLFRSPVEIMYPGALENARRRARELCRWLLVSYQVPTEFCCQAMNRDCWNDPQLQEYIKENCVFVQLTEGSSDAERYVSFYPFDGLHPHTALIDPRTGERVKTLLLATIPVPGFRVIQGAGEMLEELVGFMSDNPIDEIVPSRPTFIEAVNTEVNDDAQQAERATSPTAGKKPKVTFTMPEEPPADAPSTTVIQLRLPDGSRLKRRFLLASALDEVFAVAEAACQQSRHEFELRSAEGVVEEGDSAKEIGQMAGLKNSVLTIVHK